MAKTNKGASALKKINTRVNALAKKFPGKKRKTLQKQAGAEYRAGKLKAKRKKTVSRKKTVTRKRRKVAAKVGARKRVKRMKRAKRVIRRARVPKVRVITRTRTKVVKIGSRRSVGKKSIMPIVAIAALGIGAFLLMRKQAPQAQLVYTGNPTRDNQAANIIAYAQAAGATATAIANLIKAINQSNASQVSTLQQAISAQNSLQDDSSVQSIINQTTGAGNVAGYIPSRIMG